MKREEGKEEEEEEESGGGRLPGGLPLLTSRSAWGYL